MASKAYGYREGDKWVREVEYAKHFYRKYQAWGFHPHFRQVFKDPTLTGCEIRETKTGSVHWIDSETWLREAVYRNDPRPQFTVGREHFKTTQYGRKLTPKKAKQNHHQ